MAEAYRLGLVGIGKIARDQHLPSIAASPRFRLTATASRNAEATPVPAYRELASMIAAHPNLDAISFCTPPSGRYDQALSAIEAGLHVMLEKPPAPTVGEVGALAAAARRKGVTLFASWHSRAAGAVEPARAWLADKKIRSARIRWKEDIRRWHPGQDWILEAGGFGVFDPGINALSILTRIIDAPLSFHAGLIEVPHGRASPIRADLMLAAGEALVDCEFDFLQAGPQQWDIEVDTDAGLLRLFLGGSILQLPNAMRQEMEAEEYPRLYARFAELIDARESDVDARPLEIVEQALARSDRRSVDAFTF